MGKEVLSEKGTTPIQQTERCEKELWKSILGMNVSPWTINEERALVDHPHFADRPSEGLCCGYRFGGGGTDEDQW